MDLIFNGHYVQNYFSLPSDLWPLLKNISFGRFHFDRYYNKPGLTYYQAPIDIGPLFDVNHNMIGYRIFYREFTVGVDNILNEIQIEG